MSPQRFKLIARAYQKMKKFFDFDEHRPKDEVWSVDRYAKILEKSDKSLRLTKPLELNRSKIGRKLPFSPLFLHIVIAIAMISA